MNDSARPVILLCTENPAANITYHFLRERFHVGGVVMEDSVSRAEFLKRRVKRLGFAKVANQVLFQTLVLPVLARESRKRTEEIKNAHRLDESPIASAVISRVASANSDECIFTLNSMSPAVVVICGTRILSEKVLTSVHARFINMHAGITPLYRGVHGGYWALVQGDAPHCGVTVHVVDSGIDTGEVLYQATIKPSAADNFATYPLLQLAEGLPLLGQAVQDTLRGELKKVPPPEGKSRLWSHPGLSEYLRNRRRLGVR